MAFYLYKLEEQKEGNKSREHFKQLKKVSIAGHHNAIYKIWEKKEKPLNKGWHITAEQLIKEINYPDKNSNQTRFIIDYAPNRRDQMTLIELLDIYIYTYGEKRGSKVTAFWSPLMLRIRDIFDPDDEWPKGEWFKHPISHEAKDNRNQKFPVPKYYREESNKNHSFEFLYLQGDKQKWNWGRTGSVNAAFIKTESWKFFKNFLSF